MLSPSASCRGPALRFGSLQEDKACSRHPDQGWGTLDCCGALTRAPLEGGSSETPQASSSHRLSSSAASPDVQPEDRSQGAQPSPQEAGLGAEPGTVAQALVPIGPHGDSDTGDCTPSPPAVPAALEVAPSGWGQSSRGLEQGGPHGHEHHPMRDALGPFPGVPPPGLSRWPGASSPLGPSALTPRANEHGGGRTEELQ